ncbi:hypothetical protein [Alteromonas oceanisediminis]|uniref:hypothetical protein n=1 Tax=Alteromonas oceanisediminis TaxID=2836180 RepID=UPI001BD97AC2|nr:hypothetical protein [Alteromonas oceanisediminis]MBT0586171.1 hypothetical protein [Alteromonas oceanisediminis]
MMLRYSSFIFAIAMTCPSVAASQLEEKITEWLGGQTQQPFKISFNKQKIQFQGCKQKAYDLLISKPITDRFSIDMSLGYAKGRNSFGVYSQTVLIKEYQIMPRWHFEGFAVGMGITVQSAHELRSSHGPDIRLPLQKAYAIEADLPAFAENHSTRVSLAHETWQAEDVAFTDGSYSAKNTALTVSYSIAF